MGMLRVNKLGQSTMMTKISRNLSVFKTIPLSGKKSAPKGVNSVDDETVRNNLMGVSRYMNKKGWLDAQGRKGKGYGVYRFANKYGTNVDGYSQSIHRMNGATPVILSHWVRKGFQLG